MNKLMIHFAKYIMIMAIIVGLVACTSSTDTIQTSPSPSPTTSPKDTQVESAVELNIATQESGEVLENLKLLIDDLEAKQPGLKINLTTYDSSVYRFEKLPAMMSANTPPDLFIMFGGTDLEKYVATGNLLSLNDFLKESGLDQKFLNLEDASINDQVYRLPSAMFAEGFFYNKKILKELNAELPTTYDEFLSLLAKAKNAGIIPIGMTAKDGWATTMMMNTMWVRNAGVDATERLAAGKLKWTDPEMMNAFKQYENLVKQGYFTKGAVGYPYGDLQAQFLQGKTLFIYDGSWQATKIDGKDSTLAGQVGFMSFPSITTSKVEQNTINSANNAGYALSAKLNTEQKKAAYELLTQLFSEKYAINSMVTAGQPPAIRVNVNQVEGLVPAFKDVVNAINSSKARFAAQDVYLSSDVQATLAESIQKLLSGVATAEQVVKEIQIVQDKALAEKK